MNKQKRIALINDITGHTRAAGCELLGNLDNAKNAILAEVQAEFDRPEMQEEG